MMNNSSMLREGTILRGIYRIEKQLATGGFGNTYIAINTEFDERVAIKEFFIKGKTERDETTSSVSVSNVENMQEFEEQRDKFKKEARRIRKLNNKHIIRVYDLFEENGTAYYVMDYIDGESLADRLKHKNCPMSEQEVLQILPQILDALKTVHDINLWHLDLKPGNIMMDKQGQVTLIDFGASKHIEKDGVLTTSSAMAKTEGFFPPEQTSQTMKNIGAWTDIYSLGATLYKLLTNSNPPTFDDILNDGLDAFNFPNTISSSIKDLIVWMMKPNRKQRPQSIDEIIKYLDANGICNTSQYGTIEDTLIAKATINPKSSSEMESVDDVINDEETILERNHQEVRVKDEETILMDDYPQKKQESVVNTNSSDEGSNTTTIITTIAVLIVVVIGFIIGANSNNSSSSTESSTLSSTTDVKSNYGTVDNNNVREETPQNNNQTSNYKGKIQQMHGVVDKYPITMTLQIEGTIVKGSLYYDRYGPEYKLYLSGTLKNNQIYLDETDDDGEYTGCFQGYYTNGVIQGDYIKNNGNSMSFRVSD